MPKNPLSPLNPSLSFQSLYKQLRPSSRAFDLIKADLSQQIGDFLKGELEHLQMMKDPEQVELPLGEPSSVVPLSLDRPLDIAHNPSYNPSRYQILREESWSFPSLPMLLHDKKARRVATNHRARTIQSVDILFLALLRGYVSLTGFKSLLRELAILTGMDPATLFEREALAEEIAARLELPPADTGAGDEDNGSDSPT